MRTGRESIFQVCIDSAPIFSRVHPWTSECSKDSGNVGFEFVAGCVALLLFCSHFGVTQVAQQTALFENQSSMYSYLFFQSQCAVYVKLPFHAPDSPHFGYTQHGHFYVGSTAVSVAKWDFNRQAKFKQLRKGEAVHVELSLRYWSSSGIFNIYNTIVLEAHTTYDHAWVREHCLISYWQPAFSLGIRWFTTVIMNSFEPPFFVQSCTFKVRWTRGLT